MTLYSMLIHGLCSCQSVAICARMCVRVWQRWVGTWCLEELTDGSTVAEVVALIFLAPKHVCTKHADCSRQPGRQKDRDVGWPGNRVQQLQQQYRKYMEPRTREKRLSHLWKKDQAWSVRDTECMYAYCLCVFRGMIAFINVHMSDGCFPWPLHNYHFNWNIPSGTISEGKLTNMLLYNQHILLCV